MKIAAFSLSLLLIGRNNLATTAREEHPIFRPLQISYRDLLRPCDGETPKALLEALTSVGMVSIKDMPPDFRQAKSETLSWLHSCASESSEAKQHVFDDGTRRRTLATSTHTTQLDVGSIISSEDSTNEECHKFQQASVSFRQGVDELTRAFARTLSDMLDTTLPLLKTASGNEELRYFLDVVNQGEHLEHFHSYQKGNNADQTEMARDGSETSSTIEWHRDQGLFLVFTPGLLLPSPKKDDNSQQTTMKGRSNDFFVELPDGTQAVVDLNDSDDLVVLLGDGVDQYVNPYLNTDKNQNLLRAMPHALSMSPTFPKQARVWYGRMVLPPSNALHPIHQQTFGQLRQQMIHMGDNKQVMALGCASAGMVARQLEESACEEGTLLCWHRCMNVEEYDVSADICEDQGLDLRCVNPRNQLWDDTHGDWFPGCVNASTAENATDLPKLPNYPRDETVCTEAVFVNFVESNMASYTHQADLTNGGMLLWSVDGENINGLLAYNGLFGFTALGFAGIAGGNMMHGGKIAMATPSESYSPATGFNYSYDPMVAEYIISTDEDEKAFRHWMSPVATKARAAGNTISNISSYEVTETDCFTAMTFNTPGIYDQSFNVSGTDKLIWAANGEDSYAGYHGPSRGIIYVNWATGEVTDDVHDHSAHADDDHDYDADDTMDDHHDADDGHDHGHDHSVEESSGASSASMILLWVMGFVCGFQVV